MSLSCNRFHSGLIVILLRLLPALLPALLLNSCSQTNSAHDWIQLFNGKDLTGWTPKFSDREPGVNFRQTFQVEDGILKISYQGYETFDNAFGHLFHDSVFSRYHIRVEYRFTGEQVPEGPAWGLRNNGVMLHAQSPASMAINQHFPVSVEAQLLGGDRTGERTTGNVCTPGTHIEMNGELITRHCTNSRSLTFHGNQWVTFEAVVRGDSSITHIVNGDTVLVYEKPQLDITDPDARRLLDRGADIALKKGYIAIQAESHPTEFRKIEIQRL